MIPNSPPLELYLRSVSGIGGFIGKAAGHIKRKLTGRYTYLPCFFTGAITNRQGKSGPFFSGLRIQLNPFAPMVSVSDPLMACDPELSLGWYTGLPNTNTQQIVTRVLAHVASVARKPLLLIGGSGGGFAAILYASLLENTTQGGSVIAPQTTAFAWNPQVKITAYSFVHPYLRLMFPDNPQVRGEEAERRLQAAGVVSNLNSLPCPSRLLYLQNESDHVHLRNHAMPYLKAHGFMETGKGSYALSQTQRVLFLNYGEGHVPLPRKAIRQIIQILKKGSFPCAAIKSKLQHFQREN